MRILHLYRPMIPDLRAQAIQVLHTSHALARRGHEVAVFVMRREGYDPSAQAALAPYGLEPHPRLDLVGIPWRHPGLAGLDFRLRALRTMGADRARPKVVYARTKRHALEASRWKRALGFRLIFESHEAESAQRRERGEPHQAAARLEARVLAGCDALVTNCEGTLEQLEELHGRALPALRRVIHNGTDPARQRPPIPHEGVLAGYLGSLRAYKNIHTLLEAAELLPEGFRVKVVGGSEGHPELARARSLAGPRSAVLPAVPYAMVPELLAGLDVLVLSLSDDLYGRRLASPLKLWDYLATGAPVVAPDLPSVHAITDAAVLYRPGDAASLARAIERAATQGRAAPVLRSWDQRAAEIEALIEELA
jgi:glycosyltransferase involved in cell wall biosynthesis